MSSQPALFQKPKSTEERMDQLERRQVRIETRLVRLLDHFGLDPNGLPVSENRPSGVHEADGSACVQKRR